MKQHEKVAYEAGLKMGTYKMTPFADYDYDDTGTDVTEYYQTFDRKALSIYVGVIVYDSFENIENNSSENYDADLTVSVYDLKDKLLYDNTKDLRGKTLTEIQKETQSLLNATMTEFLEIVKTDWANLTL